MIHFSMLSGVVARLRFAINTPHFYKLLCHCILGSAAGRLNLYPVWAVSRGPAEGLSFAVICGQTSWAWAIYVGV